MLLKQLPNLLTLINLYCGVLAIVNVFTMNMLEESTGIQVNWSIVLILAAAGFDFMDGLAARLLNAQSEVGKQLDSLADLVTFGVAPAMLLIDVVLYSHAHLFRHDSMQQYAVAVILALPLFAAVRLAIFNVKDSQKGFSGLPTPAMALVVLSFIATVTNDDLMTVLAPYLSESVVMLFVLFLCALMVLPIPLLAVKITRGKRAQDYWPQLVLVSGIVLGLIVFGVAAGLPILVWYLLVSVGARAVQGKSA